MATIIYTLSSKSNSDNKSEIIIRFKHGNNGRGLDQRCKSGVFVNRDYWVEKSDKEPKARIKYPSMRSDRMKDKGFQEIRKELEESDKNLQELESYVLKAFANSGAGKFELPKDWLKYTVKAWLGETIPVPVVVQEETEPAPKKTFLEVFAEYIVSEDKEISLGNRLHYKALWRLLKRYEIIKGVTLDFDTLSPDIIRDIQKYMRDEHKYFENPNAKTKKAMAAAPESRTPKERGENTIVILTKKLRAFVRWANGLDRDYKLSEPFTHNNPFDSISVGTEQYGTPFYLTIDERNKLLIAKLPDRLARQRDIFVFQCLIGCRVSDLWDMTKSNIVDGAIEYVPKKTQKERSTRVRVPLNNKALEILERYKDCGNKLLPFVAQQQYNEDIKEMLKLAGIDRMVTVRNSLTGKPEQRPIHEVASSHMARRTFVGNLYKRVQDPNLIGSLSGHVEGSRAFARYRDIDEDMKKKLVSMLD